MALGAIRAMPSAQVVELCLLHRDDRLQTGSHRLDLLVVLFDARAQLGELLLAGCPERESCVLVERRRHEARVVPRARHHSGEPAQEANPTITIRDDENTEHLTVVLETQLACEPITQLRLQPLGRTPRERVWLRCKRAR